MERLVVFIIFREDISLAIVTNDTFFELVSQGILYCDILFLFTLQVLGLESALDLCQVNVFRCLLHNLRPELANESIASGLGCCGLARVRG